MEQKNRLFLPLKTNAFEWYKQGKKWEIRKQRGQYNLKNIKLERLVELRRGYNTNDKMWGEIADVKVFSNAKELLQEIDFKLIFPNATNLGQAEDLLVDFVEKDESIIAFKIFLTSNNG